MSACVCPELICYSNGLVKHLGKVSDQKCVDTLYVVRVLDTVTKILVCFFNNICLLLMCLTDPLLTG